MKNVLLIMLVVAITVVTSCKKLEEYNIDKKSATEVSSSTLFSNAEKALVDQVVTPDNNLNVLRLFAQYWAATDYPAESRYDITNRAIPDLEFRNIYRDVLVDLKEAKRLIEAETDLIASADVRKNKIAITEILTVYGFQRLVDIFGNIPYEQALDPNTISPAYDDAKQIYGKLFARLDAAIANLNINAASFPAEADLIYSGKVANWKAFANSLKLKMAITVADVSDLDPAGKAASALSGGVFASADDNALFPYLGAQPNANPIYVLLVASGRSDWVGSNTLVSKLDSLKDPRISKYLLPNLKNGSTVIYKGGIYGEGNVYADFSHITNTILSPSWKGILLDYTEVQFYLAEAAARGFIAGSAEAYYNEAITSSILFWGGTTAEAATYLANPNVAYTTAGGTFKEKIATQAWIAYFDRGDLGWTTWRRLDAPKLNPPKTMTQANIPRRYTYPAAEQTLNGANYTAAAAAIGGDLQSTKLFWDKY